RRGRRRRRSLRWAARRVARPKRATARRRTTTTAGSTKSCGISMADAAPIDDDERAPAAMTREGTERAPEEGRRKAMKADRLAKARAQAAADEEAAAESERALGRALAVGIPVVSIVAALV